MANSPVDHPNHYNRGGTEVIKIIEQSMEHVAMTPYPMVGFCIGNVIKYLLRFPAKGGVEDLKKARWYLERLISTMEKSDETTTD